ncbi:MAG: Cna B-type domain-containing protein, partial [Ruminiclostridium sp.]
AFNNLYEMLSSEEITEKIHPLAWEVRVNASGYTYNTGDTIVIKDVLPEGLTYGNAAKFGVFNGWVNYNDDTIRDCLSVAAGTQGGLNTVTFTITVSDALKEKINVSSSYISVIYVTEMTKEYAGGFDTASQSEPFGNSAEVIVNGTKIADVQATQTIEPTPDNIVTKGISAQGVNANGAYANYCIDVNKNEAQIGSDATITVTDKLGSKLELVSGSVVITPSEGAAFSYNAEDNTITFTLKNSRYYRITYGVKVRQVNPPAEGTAADPDDINEKFANTVTVTGRGADNVSSVSLISDSTYYSAGYYEHDNYIKLRGSKFWSSDIQGNVVPQKVTIVITRTKNGILDTTYSSTFDVTPDAQGKWEFETAELITKDAANNVYAYNVSEVAVEGYTASYKLDGTEIAADAYVDKSNGVANTAIKELVITNTYTPVTGKLTVKKAWAGVPEGAALPGKITITLTGSDGSSYTKDIIVAGTGDAAVFTDIPLKKYSVNSEGNIVSTPITYKISESATGADAAALSNYTLKYNDAEVEGGQLDVTVTETGSVVTITNEYNASAPAPAAGSLTVVKAWEGLTADAVKPGQIIISLYGDGALVESKTMNTAAENSVIFDNLPINNAGGNAIAYYITESAAGADAEILRNYTLKYNGAEVTSGIVPVTVTAAGAAVTITNEYNASAPAPATGSLTVVKSWSYTNGISAKPDRLTINLYGDGVLVDSKTIDVAAGESSVTFSNLPIKNAVGSDIVYYITESAAGADAAILAEYTLKYNGTAMTQVPVTVAEAGSSVTITNAYTPVLGKLTVNKVWSSITAGTVKPSEITITLYDLSGRSYVKTINIAGGETSAVFDNLPVYKYSVDSGNVVTKTPIKYYVLETASGDNAAILANFTAEYPGTDDTVSGKRVFNLECEGYNKAVDILNTYNGGGTGSSTSVTTTVSDTTTTTTTTTASDTTTTTTTTTASDTTTTTTTTTAATTPETSRTTPSTIPVRPVITTTTATTAVITTTTTAATTPETTERTTNTTRPPEEEEDEIETEEEIEEIPDEDDDDNMDTIEIDHTSTGITDEENPNTGIVLNWQLLASAVFAAAAILPQRKKKK